MMRDDQADEVPPQESAERKKEPEQEESKDPVSPTTFELTAVEEKCFKLFESLLVSITKLPREQLFGRLYCVGGWPRDKLLKKPSKDIDMIICRRLLDKFENELLCLDERTRARRHEKRGGQNRDLIRFDLWGLEFDVREFVSNDPESLTVDVTTRDFNINCIYYDLVERKVYDPMGFLPDFQTKTIRSSHDIDSMFLDKNRFVRYFRLKTSLGFTPDEELLQYVKLHAPKRFRTLGLEERRRFAIELRKILTHPKRADILTEMCSHQMFSRFQLLDNPKNAEDLPLYMKKVATVLEKESVRKVFEFMKKQPEEEKELLLILGFCFFFFKSSLGDRRSDPYRAIGSCFFKEQKLEYFLQEFKRLLPIVNSLTNSRQVELYEEYLKDQRVREPHFVVFAVALESKMVAVNKLLCTAITEIFKRYRETMDQADLDAVW